MPGAKGFVYYRAGDPVATAGPLLQSAVPETHSLDRAARLDRPTGASRGDERIVQFDDGVATVLRVQRGIDPAHYAAVDPIMERHPDNAGSSGGSHLGVPGERHAEIGPMLDQAETEYNVPLTAGLDCLRTEEIALQNLHRRECLRQRFRLGWYVLDCRSLQVQRATEPVENMARVGPDLHHRPIPTPNERTPKETRLAAKPATAADVRVSRDFIATTLPV
jgi:hypothetical protein